MPLPVLRMLMDVRFNPLHDAVQSIARHEVREEKRPITTHTAAVPIHAGEIGADVRREINLVDYKQV